MLFRSGLTADRAGWPNFASASLTSATDARPTRFCRTQQPDFAQGLRQTMAPFVCTPLDRSRETRPATALAPTLPRPPQPAPRRDDGRRPSERDRMAGVVRVIWGRVKEEYFRANGLTNTWGDLPVGQNREGLRRLPVRKRRRGNRSYFSDRQHSIGGRRRNNIPQRVIFRAALEI